MTKNKWVSPYKPTAPPNFAAQLTRAYHDRTHPRHQAAVRTHDLVDQLRYVLGVRLDDLADIYELYKLQQAPTEPPQS